MVSLGASILDVKTDFCLLSRQLDLMCLTLFSPNQRVRDGAWQGPAPAPCSAGLLHAWPQLQSTPANSVHVQLCFTVKVPQRMGSRRITECLATWSWQAPGAQGVLKGFICGW